MRSQESVEEALEESFPASDPPSWTPIARVGAPARAEDGVECPDDVDPKAAWKQFLYSLEEPCIPGEMEGWTANLLDAMQRVHPCMRRLIEESRTEDYERIVAQDPEMYRHIELLKQADERLLKEFAVLEERVKKLTTVAELVEPDEAKLHEHVDLVVREGMTFVVDWKRQEIAVRSCVQESFHRERGVAD